MSLLKERRHNFKDTTIILRARDRKDTFLKPSHTMYAMKLMLAIESEKKRRGHA